MPSTEDLRASHESIDQYYKLQEFESNGPQFVKDLVALREHVKKHGQKGERDRDEYTFMETSGELGGTISTLYEPHSTTFILDSLTKDEFNKPLLKTRIVYRGDGGLFLGLNTHLVSEEILNGLEQPGESEINPSFKGFRDPKQWEDMLGVYGPADSLGPNTVAFIEEYLALSKQALNIQT